MDRKELNELLGLKPDAYKDITRKAVEMITQRVATERPNVTYQPTVLHLDKWDRAEGEELAASRKDLSQTVGADALADFRGVTYLPEPKTNDACSDRKREEYIKALLDTPDCKVLRQSTVLNRVAADAAAIKFAEEYAKLIGADRKNPKRHESNLLRAVCKGLQAAEEEVEDVGEVITALGCGDEDGKPDGKMSLDRVKSAFSRIKSNHQVHRIMEEAGRFIRSAAACQRRKTIHGRDDVVGIEPGGDLARLTAAELTRLCDPELELDALRRLVEGQASCKQYRGVEKVGKGPIVLCVDESYSMNGAPIIKAKAFALAMAWIARHQKRWMLLSSFSHGPATDWCLLKPKEPNEQKLLDWLGHFYGGGTSLDGPLDTIPNKVWPVVNPPKGITDICILTDAAVGLEPSLRDSFLTRKKANQVKCHGLVLGGSAGTLASVCDSVRLLQDVDPSDPGVTACLSL